MTCGACTPWHKHSCGANSSVVCTRGVRAVLFAHTFTSHRPTQGAGAPTGNRPDPHPEQKKSMQLNDGSSSSNSSKLTGPRQHSTSSPETPHGTRAGVAEVLVVLAAAPARTPLSNSNTCTNRALAGGTT